MFGDFENEIPNLKTTFVANALTSLKTRDMRKQEEIDLFTKNLLLAKPRAYDYDQLIYTIDHICTNVSSDTLIKAIKERFDASIPTSDGRSISFIKIQNKKSNIFELVFQINEIK
jgi:hypothetical protein